MGSRKPAGGSEDGAASRKKNERKYPTNEENPISFSRNGLLLMHI
jgi:hypothetical protein